MKYDFSTKEGTDHYYSHKMRMDGIKIFLAALIVAIIAMAVLSCNHSKQVAIDLPEEIQSTAIDSLIADETTMTVLEDRILIKTSNETICKKLEWWKYAKYHYLNDNLRKDENGDYSFWFGKKDLQELYTWASKL